MRLSELKTGEQGVIVKVLGHGGFRKRIVEMGFIKGKTVEVVLNAPLKDPVKYRILGYEVSLRREEAEMIEVLSEKEASAENEADFHKGLVENISVNEEELKRKALGKRRTINVALIGNPNCGKTSLFNLASGAHEHVGNYSGVTVEAKEGYFEFEGYRFCLVDLPGTYSLSTYSPEEMYVRNYVIDKTPDVIINVVDSTNLERNLYLTTQLIDMNVRMVVALNIFDELKSSGNRLDYHMLSQLFGVPMIPTVCKHGKGIDTLFHVVINLYEGVDFFDKQGKMNPEVLKELTEWHNSLADRREHEEEHMEDYVHGSGSTGRVFRHIHINHGPELERAIDAVKEKIAQNEAIRHKYSTRFLAIKMLENDKEIEKIIRALPNSEEIIHVRDKMAKRIQSTLNEDSESAITDAKYAFIDGALKETFVDSQQKGSKTTRLIDKIVTHRIWGYPIFFLFMFIMFECTFTLGEYPQMGIEWIVEQINAFIHASMNDGPLKDMLTDGIIGGVGGVIVFLPNILILYFFISLMEDSGYMARVAFIMDKLMHKIGLHGKSFIPFVMGFGCSVPAIMSSRMIENRKNRLITILTTPLMSCSARLPIYSVLCAAFFPQHASMVLLGIYAIGIALAFVLSFVFSKFLVKGDDTPFVMELPPYRMPTSKAILRHMWEKGRLYLKKMGGIIMIASVTIWFLSYYPHSNEYGTVIEQQENSYLGQLGKFIEPAIEPLGYDWKMGIGLLSGVGAKELVVSTLGVLYADNGELDDESKLANQLQEKLPITPLVAFGYMLFTLIYFPCMATIAAIREETNSWKWALFAMTYTTALAWVVAFLVYHIGSLFA